MDIGLVNTGEMIYKKIVECRYRFRNGNHEESTIEKMTKDLRYASLAI